MAGYQDIFIDQGSTFNNVIPVKSKIGLPVDITGYFARGQFRKHWSSKKAVTFITRIDDPLSGKVYFGLTPDQTRLIKPGRYWFDIELFNDTEVPTQTIRVVEGQVHVLPRVTKGPEEELVLTGEEPYENLQDDGWFYEEG